MAARRRMRGGAIDWAELRRRLEAAAQAGAELDRAVLEERARALARPTTLPTAGDALEVVTFGLANETYALESRYVLGVFPLSDLAPLPGAEPPICGVTAWRGELLIMLDLRLALGIGSAALHDLSRVIVLGGETAAFGVLADAVRDLVRLPRADLRTLAEGHGRQRRYVRGISRDAVLVLDGDALLRLHDAAVTTDTDNKTT